MHILIHGYHYAPELIGIGRYSGEMAAWLADRGHQVTVLTALPYYPEWKVHSEYRGRGWMHEWLEGVEVFRAPMYVPAQVSSLKRIILELSFAVNSLRWLPCLVQRNWDIVIAVCPPLISSLTPLILARLGNTPFMLHLQDLQLDAARELEMIRHPMVLNLVERLEQFVFSNTMVITTISAGMSARLQSKGVPPTKLQLFPNWADLAKVSPRPRDNPKRRELGLTGEMVILYAGNMGEKQGLEIILESARMLRREKNIKFIMAGEGAAKFRLMNLAREKNLNNIIFMPLQSPGRIFHALGPGRYPPGNPEAAGR